MRVCETAVPGSNRAASMAKKKQDIDSPERGRPFIGKQVNVRIPPQLLEDLEYIATAKQNDLSAIIRDILASHVAEHLRQARGIIEDRQRAKGEGSE